MTRQHNPYKRHRFPPDIIQYAVWLYYRFNLSHSDIEDLLAQRGIIVSREAIRLWCNNFGSKYAKRLQRKHRGYGDTFFLDEVFVKIQGKLHYLWRAVDQESLPHAKSRSFKESVLGMAKSLTSSCNRAGMAKPLSVSSNAYCTSMAGNPERLSPINSKVTVSPTGN